MIPRPAPAGIGRPLRVTFALTASLLIFSAAPAAARAQDAAPRRPPKVDVKRWILERLAKGEEVYLGKDKDGREAFPDEADRVIDAPFLVALATNDAKALSAHLADFTMHRHGVRLFGAIVDGDVDLKSAEVPHVLKLSGCEFRGEVDFSQAVFKRSLALQKSVFRQPLNLSFAEVGDNFDAAGAVFEYVRAGDGDSRVSANLDSLKVAGNATLAEATFRGAANLINMRVGWNLQVDGAMFNSEAEAAVFSLMRVEGNAFLRRAHFGGPARFVSMSVGSNLNLESARFKQSPEFRNAKVGRLTLVNTTTPSARAVFESAPDFEGFTYEQLGHLSGDALAAELARAGLDDKLRDRLTDSWNGLYTYYQQHGGREEADDIYVAWQRSKRSNDLARRKYGDYAWGWVEDITSGFGKRLWYALYWSVFFIAVGCAVFWREDGMETKDPDAAERCRGRYHPIWYSIALFLPIISLEDEEVWRPKLHRRRARFYMRLHVILGYLLIPIGLAAWTGIIE